MFKNLPVQLRLPPQLEIESWPVCLRFGPRGDAYFSLTKIQAGARQESELEESVAFLKFDRSMKEWTEVHVHCPEREDMEQVRVRTFMKLSFFSQKQLIYNF